MLRDEGGVGYFLGIIIKNTGKSRLHLTQIGLIKKVPKMLAMTDYNPVSTKYYTTALGIDTDDASLNESSQYSNIIGMLMYLASNSHTDISFVVHQCASFTYVPCQSHSKAVKHIICYIKSTEDKGLILELSHNLQLYFYVGTGFVGLWGIEEYQNPLSVKPHTGVIIMFIGILLSLVSKLKYNISLRTMEREYITLSQSMCELIGIREVFKEIQFFSFLGNS